MKINLSRILFLLCSPLFLMAQEEMTLEKAISIGLENNYNIKIAETNIAIAENNDSWAVAGSGVTVDLNGSFNNNIIENNNPASFIRGAFYSGSLGAALDANWVVYNGGRIAVSKEILEKAVDQQKLNKLSDIQDLLREIYQNYYAVIYQQAQESVLSSILETSRDRLAYEQTKKEFGSSNSFNLLQFENAIVTDSINVISQSQAINIAQRQLYSSLELIGPQNYKFTESLSVYDETIDAEALKQTLSEENFTLKSLAMLANVNRLNTKITKSNRKPTLRLNGALGFTENAFKIFDDNPNTGDPFPLQLGNQINLGINALFNWRLYDGGARNIELQNAKLQEEIDQLSILQAQAQLNDQLDILISNYNNQLNLLQLTENQVSLARRNIEMTEDRFKAGLVTSLDFRAVQNQFLQAASARINAIYSLIQTKIEIDYLVGVFGE